MIAKSMLEHVMIVLIQIQRITLKVVSVLVTMIWSAVVAYIAIQIAGLLCGGIRSSEDDETEGLDVTDHGEGGYQL